MKRIRESEKAAIAYEYLSGELPIREVAEKYGINYSRLHKWVKKYREERLPKAKTKLVELPVDVKKLQDELHKAQLHNKLLEAMIDISKEQYGIDLRKKPGAKQS
jgi:transposase-like protein